LINWKRSGRINIQLQYHHGEINGIIVSNYFKYPEEIRKVIYTTNIIESVHRQFGKLTKTKGGFPNENSLLKLLYMGILNAQKKWTMLIKNWSLTLSQLGSTEKNKTPGKINCYRKIGML